MADPADTRGAGGRPLIRELAHELRDALSPLASSAVLARLRGFDAETSRLLAEKVERGLRRTLSILDAFVLAEQCESGVLQLAMRPVALADILQAARAGLAELERERCIFMSDGGQAVADADLARAAQVLQAVLQQLLTVASADSSIEVRAMPGRSGPEIRARSHTDPRATPGDEWLAGYRSGDASMALRTAHRIMALQGGGLDLVKGDDGGCELVMRFRAADGQPAAERCDAPRSACAAPAVAAPASDARRILIVDDSLEVRRAYGEALTALGYTVTEAADAGRALSALEGDAPEVALIDVHLPGVNGFRLAKTIRGRCGGSIYLVMLSGMALDAATRDFAREAGFDACLDKMAGPRALRDLIEAAIVRESR
jgi:CheY-like chemotaxis protein